MANMLARTSTPAAVVIYRPDHAQLSALLSGIGAERRVFVFLNGPPDEGTEEILARFVNLRQIRSPQNIGLGSGLNALMTAAREEGFVALVLFDQDSAPMPGLIDRLADRWRDLTAEGHRIAALGPRLGLPSDQGYKAIRYAWRGKSLATGAATVDFLPTSGSLVSISTWAAVGPFRDDYFIGSIDVEWGFRAWSQGYQSICLLDVEMAHRWGTPVVEPGQGWRPQIVRQSDLRTFYYLRNTVDLLRQPYVPRRTKVESAIRLMGQICVLLIWRRLNWQAFNVVGRALWAGAKGRLGPAPETIWKDDF
ncbi:glycosyltransferase (plasmid) [Acidithiobacillus ferrooxidans]|nr:glycosyltransferase [Acidithiobacillus ferrooxidans]